MNKQALEEIAHTIQMGGWAYAEDLIEAYVKQHLRTMVGCERADGTLNIHASDETCDECHPKEA